MKKCKHCGSRSKVKSGIVNKKQRYECSECGRTFREGDKRVSYSDEKRLKVIKMYLEGVGIRSIKRLEGVSTPLIIRWVRQFKNLLEKKMREAGTPKDVKNIQILELDELYSSILLIFNNLDRTFFPSIFP